LIAVLMEDEMLRSLIRKAAKAIAESDSLLITAGAGMGVDSGLPDFRGKDGFWRAYPPMQKLGLEFSSVSTPSWFHKDPAFAFGFWKHHWQLYTSTKEHDGYHLLRRFADKKQRRFVFTSNVDGHFERVFDVNNEIVECHGTVMCFQCCNASLGREGCRDALWSSDAMKDVKFDEEVVIDSRWHSLR
jgi:NAD-dependent SIR2 family protein deacetylase